LAGVRFALPCSGIASALLLGVLASGARAEQAQPAPAPRALGMAELLAATAPADWRVVDPAEMLVMELASGRVVIELAPAFAPVHVANIKQLVRDGYFDGLTINRAQDNFVVQWGDPDEQSPRSLKGARATLDAEFTTRAFTIPFTPLPDADGYAPQVGFSAGMPAARDSAAGQAWLAHCYAMVGAGRGNAPESGNGSELYVVIGHAPRQLDRNIALVGRVLQGMEQLAVLPRGSGPLGFYERPEQRVPIRSVRLGADIPHAERPRLEVLRTDRPAFEQLVELRRNRRDEWYQRPAGYIDLCNVPIPVRTAAPSTVN
jgi:peptidylprolyl isomerase